MNSATESLQTGVVLLHADLLFVVKVKEASEPLNLKVISVRDPKGVADKAAGGGPVALILDLNSSKADPFLLLEEAQKCGVNRVVCFFSHVDTELAARAEAMGVQEVLPRSAFTRDLPLILKHLFD